MYKIYGIMESVAVKKEREIILYNRLKYCTKEILKLLTIASIALFIIIAIVFVKYDPVYAVKINDQIIGYVKSKKVMEDIINEQVLTSDNACAVFTELNETPTYELTLSSKEANDEYEIAQVLAENTTTLYKFYAITVNGENKTSVNTLEDKEDITVKKEGGVYIVSGDVITKLMRTVNLEDNESLHYFHRRLNELGVNDRLRVLGIKDGDLVQISDWELEWEE